MMCKMVLLQNLPSHAHHSIFDMNSECRRLTKSVHSELFRKPVGLDDDNLTQKIRYNFSLVHRCTGVVKCALCLQCYTVAMTLAIWALVVLNAASTVWLAGLQLFGFCSTHKMGCWINAIFGLILIKWKLHSRFSFNMNKRTGCIYSPTNRPGIQCREREEIPGSAISSGKKLKVLSNSCTISAGQCLRNSYMMMNYKTIFLFPLQFGPSPPLSSSSNGPTSMGFFFVSFHLFRN